MATQPYAATANCSLVALVRAPCISVMLLSSLCGVEPGEIKSIAWICLSFLPLSSRLDVPSAAMSSQPPLPHGAFLGHGRAGASPQLQCHPGWQQGPVPGACLPSTADGVGEAAGPAWPRTSAPTLSMSDSQSCQGLTGLMIVGAAGQEPPGTGQVRTPASCTLAAPPGTEGSPGKQDMSPAVAPPGHSAPPVCDSVEVAQ